MMTKYVYFTTILLLTIHNLWSQNRIKEDTIEYKIKYDFIYMNDTIDKVYAKPVAFTLFRIRHFSRFLSSAICYNDSIFKHFYDKHPEPVFSSADVVQKYMEKKALLPPMKGIRSEININKDFNKGLFQSKIPLTFVNNYMEESLVQNWTLTDEVDTIMGLVCSKATTKYGGRKYLAWFTPEIPVMDGPYVFAGLPGLILRVKDDEDFYIFEATEIQVGRQSIFYDPEIINKYSQKLDRKTFVEDIIKFKNSPYVLGRLNSTPEEKLALKKRYLSRMDLLIEKY